MSKRLLFGETGRRRFLRGVDCLADVTARTLGPLGKNVLVEQPAGLAPLVTCTGRDLARHVELDDPFANLGVRALREAAAMVFSAAGDGTSTAIVLARRMIRAAAIELRAGTSAERLREGMLAATVAAVTDLARQALPCSDRRLVESVARSAAHGDESVAATLAAAVEAAGDGGRIRLEMGRAADDQLEVTTGHEIARGHRACHFPVAVEGASIALARPLVFVCDAPLSRIEDVQRALALAHAAGRPLFVVAPSVTDDALRTLVLNHVASRVTCACLIPPLSDDDGRALLEDVAVLTGAQELPEPALLRDARDFGSAEEIVVGPESTTLRAPAGDPTRIAKRIAHVRRRLAEGDGSTISPTAEAHAQGKLEERLRTLGSAQVAVHVGGRSEAVLKARLARYEAAYAALSAALEEGVVAGGGSALVHAIAATHASAASGLDVTDRAGAAGARVLAASLREPLRLIAESAGVRAEEAERAVLAAQSARVGFDARSASVCDLVEAGVVDSVRVVRLALQTATGVATTVMAAEVMMVRARSGLDSTFDPSEAASTREHFWGGREASVASPASRGRGDFP